MVLDHLDNPITVNSVVAWNDSSPLSAPSTYGNYHPMRYAIVREFKTSKARGGGVIVSSIEITQERYVINARNNWRGNQKPYHLRRIGIKDPKAVTVIDANQMPQTYQTALQMILEDEN